ncbi:unnamed protein product [Oikopleura dioica]|uniref:Glycosyl transferase CAP10 domain-containing protein n=1 Tax=Oikopleura dioica TaxID=34765 RepID=E4XD46_OIKDI|nr:unnamed protein product [Oikopleura dioica]
MGKTENLKKRKPPKTQKKSSNKAVSSTAVLATVSMLLLLLFLSAFVFGKSDEWQFYGPGLSNSAATPTRYFYARAVDSSGAVIDARELNKDDIKWEVLAKSGSVKVDKEIGFKFDGSIFFRYRMRGSAPNGIIINVKYKKKQVFRKILSEPIYDESCYCPSSLSEFYSEFDCPANFEQLDEDLAQFDEIDLDRLYEDGKKKKWAAGGHGEATAHVVIKDQKLFVEDFGTIMGFRGFMSSMFLSLLRKVKLPDAEFIFNLGDWPLEENLTDPQPILTWCGSSNTSDIAVPTWDQTKNTRHALFRERKDIQYVEQISGEVVSWNEKIERGYFRGRDSNPSRLKLCELSMAHPEDIDARLTWNLHNKKGQDPKKYGEQVKHVSYPEMGKFKYQVLVDGTVAPYRTALLMQMDSVILKQKSMYYEWWYRYMKPWQHFIPIEEDLSDLREKIEWARNNDEKARQIALNANALASQWMNPEFMYCYYAKTIELYSKKQSRHVKVTKNHEELTQESDPDLNNQWKKYFSEQPCDCRKQTKDEL